MENELQTLIEALQREHDYLEAELNACIKEWDFEGAEAFKVPLMYTREKLRILKNLENPDYDKIMSLKSGIERYKNLEAESEFMNYHIQKIKDNILEYEKELFHLENKKKQFNYDSDVLIVCLEKIINKEISKVEFEVESEGIVFDLSTQEKSLIIEIRRTDKNRLDETITASSELKKMGFQVNEKNAIIDISDFQEKKILPTIELLARITYEVFRLYGGKKANIRWGVSY